MTDAIKANARLIAAAPVPAKRIAEIGDFEIWQASSGMFEVYSPTNLSAVFRCEARAREWAETAARKFLATC
jgi:hypothetical protein